MAAKKGSEYHEEVKRLLSEFDLSAADIAKKFFISRRMVYYIAGTMGLDMDERTRRIRAQRLVTEDMVTAAIKVLRHEVRMPYEAYVQEFTPSDITAGLLREAETRCEEQNRDVVRRALEAAIKNS